MPVNRISSPKMRMLSKKLRKNAPKILKAVGLAGLIASPVLAVRGTVLAVRAYDKRKEELCVEKLPVGEIVKTTWKYYIPVVAVTGVSTASVLKGDSIQEKKMTLLTAAYGAAERTLADYKDKMVEAIGENKAKEIDKEVAEKQMIEAKQRSPYIQSTGYGDLLFYEPVTGTYFYSTTERVLDGARVLSMQLLNENYVDLNDLFYIWGLKPTDAGRVLGWSLKNCNAVTIRLPGYADDPDFPQGVFRIAYDNSPTTDFMNY